VDDKRARSATVDYSKSDQVVRNTRRRKDEPAPAPAQPLEPHTTFTSYTKSRTVRDHKEARTTNDRRTACKIHISTRK
jgi:hypothetical protein